MGPLQTHHNEATNTFFHFTKWPEAIQLKDKSSFSVVCALFKQLCEKGAALF